MADIVVFYAPINDGAFQILQTAHRECFEIFRQRFPHIPLSKPKYFQNCGEARCRIHDGIRGNEAPYPPRSG